MSDKKTTPQEEQISKLRKLTKKRWFYPAVYLCAAAVVMIGSLWIQHSMSDNQHKEKGQTALHQGKNEAIPVNSAKEVFKWPVADKNAVKVAVPFYDVNADATEQAAALLNYDNTFVPNKGICIVSNDNKSFDVMASMSGKVVKAQKDDLLGYVVDIEHKDGVHTIYQSLASIAVEEGQTVTQGDVIGTAGTEKLMTDLGPHLHFEIRKDGVAVNPTDYFQKGLASLDDVNKATEKTSVDKQNNNDSESNVKENTPSPEESSTSTDQGDQTDASHS